MKHINEIRNYLLPRLRQLVQLILHNRTGISYT